MSASHDDPPAELAVADPVAPRKRGRPPRTIDTDAVIAAVERLFAEGGIDAVTIERTASEMAVSRATLYRTIPTKQHLLGILFNKMNDELSEAAREVTQRPGTTALERLTGLIQVQIEAAVRMRDYLFVYVDRTRIPKPVYEEWRRWTDGYEHVWISTVANAIASGDLPPGDVRLTTRLLLGMTIWVANWYRPRENISPDEIHQRALEVLGLARVSRTS
jgi:AcrR family transcriptional regulator